MSKELTEQWRNRTLKDGAYYILVDKYEQNEPEIDVGICYNSNFEWWIVKEVLAPVPDYHDLCELRQELEICKDDKADLYAKLCNALMQLEEANKVIKWYDGLENILISWEMITGQPKGTAKDYLEKWGVK